MKKTLIKFVIIPIISVLTIFAILIIAALINENSITIVSNILFGIPIVAILLIIPINIFFIIKRKDYIWLLLIILLPILGSIIYYFIKYKKYE